MRHVSAVSGIVFTSITHFFKDKLVLYICLYVYMCVCARAYMYNSFYVFLHLAPDTENFFF